MNLTNHSKNKYIFVWGIFLLGIILLFVSLFFTPSNVSKYLTSDNSFANITIYKVWILRTFSFILGIVIVLYFILKLTKAKLVNKIDYLIEKYILRNFKQPKRVIQLIFILMAIITLFRIFALASNDKWKNTTGHEYYWIAQSIAKGEGFSFPANHRWLFVDFQSKYSQDDYYPTAWEEPIYPYFVGIMIKNFGDYGKLFVLISHIIFFYFTTLVVFLITKKLFRTNFGIVPSLILFLGWPEIRALSEMAISPVMLAGFLLCLSVYMFLLFLENYSIKRSIILGTVLGITTLTMSAALLFVPSMILLSVIYKKGSKVAFGRAFTVIFVFLIVLLPWMIRNYVVFDEIILVRNGVGQGLHHSNVIVASTYSEGKFAHENILGPIWKSKSEDESLREISNNSKKRIAVLKRSYDAILIEAPAEFRSFNEAQRDKFYLKRSKDFILNNPSIFIDLTFHRLKMFLTGWKKKHLIISFLAIIGVLFWLKNTKVLFVAFITSGYIFTFSIIGAWFYRYRYPIEPLLFVLSFGSVYLIFRKVYNLVNKKFLV